jgi:galactoside O-acetyltransferase
MNYSVEELSAMGFASLGREVKLHRSAIIINPGGIALGNNCRIDCHCVLSCGSQGICIGSCTHIAAGSYLFGGGGSITMEDFSALSSRVAIYTASDDFTEGFMTNPTVPDEFKKLTVGPVTLRKHAIVGAGSVILPGVELGVGSAIGALTCIRKSVPDFHIMVGNPARPVGERKRLLLELETQFKESPRGRELFSQSDSP